MTIKELETGKKLFDAIKANERVLEHLNNYKNDHDKTGILVKFLTQCKNLNASISKDELAQFLFDMLVDRVTSFNEAAKKALDAL